MYNIVPQPSRIYILVQELLISFCPCIDCWILSFVRVQIVGLSFVCELTAGPFYFVRVQITSLSHLFVHQIIGPSILPMDRLPHHFIVMSCLASLFIILHYRVQHVCLFGCSRGLVCLSPIIYCCVSISTFVQHLYSWVQDDLFVSLTYQQLFSYKQSNLFQY